MSDVSKTNELIEKLALAAEDAAGGPPSAEQVDALVAYADALRDALEAATRVPVQGEPNDDREHLARLLAAQGGEEWDRLVGTAEYARNRYLRRAGAILDRMPKLSRAAVPDAATEAIDWQKIAVEQTHLERGRAEQAEAERDAALAAIGRVRAAVDGPHPANSGLDSVTLAHVSAALDGAPEPECLSIPIPNVPFGPEGVAPNIATASYLIEVVKKLDFGYANVGGSNVTATLRKILVDTAEALRSLPVGGESKP